MSFDQSGTTTTTQTPTTQQQNLLGQILPTFQNFANNPPTVGARPVQDFNPLEIQGQEAAVGAIPGIQQNFANVLGNLQGGQNFISGLQNTASQGFGSGIGGNQYVQAAQDATLAPITEALTQQVLPNIRQGAIAGGQLGGSRQGLAEDQSVNNYLRTATQAVAPFAFGAQNSLLNAATGSLGLLPGLAGQQASLGLQGGLLPSQIYSSIGGAQRGLGQQQADAQYNAGLANQFLPFTIAQELLAALTGFPGGTSTVNTTTS